MIFELPKNIILRLPGQNEVTQKNDMCMAIAIRNAIIQVPQ